MTRKMDAFQPPWRDPTPEAWGVYADWLSERGRKKEEVRARRFAAGLAADPRLILVYRWVSLQEPVPNPDIHGLVRLHDNTDAVRPMNVRRITWRGVEFPGPHQLPIYLAQQSCGYLSWWTPRYFREWRHTLRSFREPQPTTPADHPSLLHLTVLDFYWRVARNFKPSDVMPFA